MRSASLNGAASALVCTVTGGGVRFASSPHHYRRGSLPPFGDTSHEYTAERVPRPARIDEVVS